jgi:hypothetical protein
MKQGKYLIIRSIGIFGPETKVFDSLPKARKWVKGLEKAEYRVFKVNTDGKIQQSNLAGR